MRKVLFAAAAIPMLAGAAVAQNGSPPANSPANTPPASMSNEPTTARTTTAAETPSKGPSFISVPDTAMLSENVVGLDATTARTTISAKSTTLSSTRTTA